MPDHRQHVSSGTDSSAPAPPRLTYLADNDVHILDRLAVLYRYRYIATAVFVLATAAIMIQSYTSLKLFRAQARLLIEDERSTAVPGVSADNSYYEDPDLYYKTQYRILKGRDLTRRVVRKLNVAAIPEFNGTAEPPVTLLTIAHDLEKRIVAFVRPDASEATDKRTMGEAPSESALVDAFIGRVTVEPVPGSKLVDVLFDSRDPKFAQAAANALVDEYVEQNLDVKLQSTQNMIEWLDKELAKQQQKVGESERGLADYRERQNAMSLDEKQNLVVVRLNKLNDDLMMARSRRAQKQAVYDQLRSIGPGEPVDTIQVIATSPEVSAAKGKVFGIQSEKARIAERYGDKHPNMQKAIADLAEAQRQYDTAVTRAAQAIKNDYETAVLEEQTFSRGLDSAKTAAQDLSRKSVDYNVMERDAKTNRDIYSTLLTRERELRVSSNSRQNNVRVIDHAEAPGGAMSPSGRRTWLLALGVGLTLGIGLAYGLDYMNDTIKTPEDIAQRLRLPFLGLVPSVRGDAHPVLASSNVPHDFGESFRALRTSMASKYPAEGTKIVAVTSAQPLEGKTTTAANMALALAYGGSRVLLIDADMRRPGLHRPLRLNNERGLSQVLMGQARVRDVIQRTVDPNLLAITAGSTPPNPSELLASERMKTLLTNLSHGPFDWILIDTPPVLAVTDAVVLAPLVSGVTFVIGAEMTRRRLAERAVETVMQARPKYAAVVLNKVDFARNKYYYSRYYGQQYKNYYAEAVS
jgi:polysaccharide biosynthesis transport protein